MHKCSEGTTKDLRAYKIRRLHDACVAILSVGVINLKCIVQPVGYFVVVTFMFLCASEQGIQVHKVEYMRFLS